MGSSLRVANVQQGRDARVRKFVFTMDSATYIESTYVDHASKHIICFSCQVGCPVRCIFVRLELVWVKADSCGLCRFLRLLIK